MSKYSYIDDDINIEPTNYQYVDEPKQVESFQSNTNDDHNNKAYDLREMERMSKEEFDQNMTTEINNLTSDFEEYNESNRINNRIDNKQIMIKEPYDDAIIEEILQESELVEHYDEDTNENNDKLNEETLDYIVYKKYKHIKRNMKQTSILDLFLVTILFIIKIVMLGFIFSGCFLPKRYLISYILVLILILILNEINDNTCIVSNKINQIMNCNTNIIEYKTLKKTMMLLIIIAIIEYLLPNKSLYAMMTKIIKLLDENNRADNTALDNKDFPTVAPDKFKIELNNEERINNLVILDTAY